VASKTKVELFAAIRRDARTEGMGIRALARKYGVHRRIVRQALISAWPAPRKKPPPRRSRLDPTSLRSTRCAGGPGRTPQAAAHGQADL
jgi:hypothetical protein